MEGRLEHPRMAEVLQMGEDLQGVVADTPLRSRAGQSLWGVEGLAAMEGLGPVLVSAAREQFLSLAVASEDALSPHSFQTIHGEGGLEGQLMLKGGPFVHLGLPGGPLVLRIEHGTALSRNFEQHHWKASENTRN